MQFIKAREKEWQEKQGYSKKVFLSSIELKHPGVLVQKIKIKAHDEAPSHYHKKQIEVFYFLNTNGFFIVNGEKIQPKRSDIIVIEPSDKHTVINNTDKDFLYLAFKLNYSEDDCIS